MPDILIPDTSCLIFLDKIREIEVLHKLYDRTVVTREVADEHISPMKQWIEIETAQEKRSKN